MINSKIVFNLLGALLIVEGFFMLTCISVALIYEEQFSYMLISAVITSLCGTIIYLSTRGADVNFGKREGYLIVSLGWVLFSLFGSLPFIISHSIPDFCNAFFESISGFTTTGASILNDIESLPYHILFWRSMTQWLGGMGIIVMSLAILPILGVGGMQLFSAEVPGPTPDKIHPRVKETAKRLWVIYILFTLAEVILLLFGGMNLFDSICHGFTTMATGGYSPKQASIAFYDSAYIQYVITFFMFLAGTNFTLSYFALNGKFSKLFKNEEFKFYIGFIIAATLLATITLFNTQQLGLEKSFRSAVFQVVSIITTTGFVTTDYLQWHPFLIVMLFLLMFLGGSAGSTGGSIKVARIVIFIKNCYMELKRLVHPSAIVPVRLDTKSILPEILTNIMAFISVYILTFAVGVVFMAFLGNNFETSFGAVAATLGNIGPGIGKVGPVENFAHLSHIAKWFLSFLMLIGRLELFTVLILLTPAFWRK
jgi:trk system potassium uptake protein TrkH